MSVEPCGYCKYPVEGQGFFARATHAKDCEWADKIAKLVEDLIHKPGMVIPGESEKLEIIFSCQLCASKIAIKEEAKAKGHLIMCAQDGKGPIWIPCSDLDRALMDHELEKRARETYDSIMSR